jgi:hypothetical protein
VSGCVEDNTFEGNVSAVAEPFQSKKSPMKIHWAI